MDDDSVARIAEVLGIMWEKLNAMDEEIDKILSCKVTERLQSLEEGFDGYLGGLSGIITDRQKGEYGEMLRGKHPELSKYEPMGKRFGIDIIGEAVNHTFDLPEEEREGAIGSMIGELSEKFDDLLEGLSKLNAHEAAETPAEEKAEQTTEGGEEKPEGKIEIEVESGDGVPDDIVKAARRFRGAKAG